MGDSDSDFSLVCTRISLPRQAVRGMFFCQLTSFPNANKEVIHVMGRTRDSKAEVVAGLKELLQESQLAMIVDYQGLSVAEITDLRRRLRPSGTTCKVTKNTLMRLAIAENDDWQIGRAHV